MYKIIIEMKIMSAIGKVPDEVLWKFKEDKDNFPLGE